MSTASNTGYNGQMTKKLANALLVFGADPEGFTHFFMPDNVVYVGSQRENTARLLACFLSVPRDTPLRDEDFRTLMEDMEVSPDFWPAYKTNMRRLEEHGLVQAHVPVGTVLTSVDPDYMKASPKAYARAAEYLSPDNLAIRLGFVEKCPECNTTDPKQHLRGCQYFRTYTLDRCHEKCPKGPFCPKPLDYPGGIHHGGYTSCYEKGCAQWSITGRCCKHQY
jgi:hypothetical protein